MTRQETLNTAATGAAGQAMLALLGTLLVLALVMACSLVWLALRDRRQRQRLRQARLQLHALGNLMDVWLWRSDAQHRITRIRPPAGSPASHWTKGLRGAALWEQFHAQDEATLRAQLDAHAPLSGVAVCMPSPEARPQARAARLSATMLTSEQGLFDGYLGIVREHDAQRGHEREQGRGPERGPEAETTPWPRVRGLPIAAAASVDTSATATATATSSAPTPTGTAASAAPSLAVCASAPAVVAAAPPPAVAQARPGGPDESLAYTLSHDLRAPIRVVEGFTRILKEDYGHVLDRIGNDHLDRVLGAAARMSGMIDALLGLSQLSAKPLERQAVNLSQLAAYVAEDLRRLSPQRQVELHIAPGLQAQGDPTLLRLVLENLLGNAWKYTGKRADAQIWFERNPAEPGTVFTVRDNGAGFDMRFADRLFGAFQRLHSASEFQGTGVGLVSVRRIVRRHGGEIWAHAEPGQGARFHFTLAPRS